jgi:hypothetical protein
MDITWLQRICSVDGKITQKQPDKKTQDRIARAPTRFDKISSIFDFWIEQKERQENQLSLVLAIINVQLM